MQKITVTFVVDKSLFINYSSFSDFSLKNTVILVGKKTKAPGNIRGILNLKSPVKDVYRRVDSFPNCNI
ncbi:MAG: hypothetical protein ACP5N0_07775 [Methanosarcina sp.]|jgi:hypothetical protein|uniref:hypothetical protein n=1 Tax=Methanosarcina sp. TaxID=2213 RepID=UPI003BB5C89A